MSAPLCLCDPPESSVKAVAGKSSKHAGREFWSCRICDFFQWVDQGGTTLSAAGPRCRCGHPSHLRITRKAGSNCGRSFWTCANTGGYSCGFFQWEFDDWEPPDSQSSSTDSEDQSCKKCGKVVKVMTVNENNQKGNAGGAVAGLSTNRFQKRWWMTRKWSCFAITTWVNNSEVDEVTPPHPCCLFAPHVNEISSIHAFHGHHYKRTFWLCRLMGHVFGAGHLRGSRLLSFFEFYYENNIVWGVGWGGIIT